MDFVNMKNWLLNNAGQTIPLSFDKAMALSLLEIDPLLAIHSSLGIQNSMVHPYFYGNVYSARKCKNYPGDFFIL